MGTDDGAPAIGATGDSAEVSVDTDSGGGGSNIDDQADGNANAMGTASDASTLSSWLTGKEIQEKIRKCGCRDTKESIATDITPLAKVSDAATVAGLAPQQIGAANGLGTIAVIWPKDHNQLPEALEACEEKLPCEQQSLLKHTVIPAANMKSDDIMPAVTGKAAGLSDNGDTGRGGSDIGTEADSDVASAGAAKAASTLSMQSQKKIRKRGARGKRAKKNSLSKRPRCLTAQANVPAAAAVAAAPGLR
jgi:hypothetical protein